MDFNQIIELVKTVSASELTTFQYEEGNQKILMQTGNVVSQQGVSDSVAPVVNAPVVNTATVVQTPSAVRASIRRGWQ